MLKEVFRADRLTKAFAAFGPVMGLSAVIAPILGGALIDADLFGSGWRAIFLVNAPLGAALGIAVLATIFFAYLDGPAPPFRAMAATTLLTLVPLALAFLAAFRLPHRARAAGAH